MTDQDYEPFMAEFRRMASAFERYPQSMDAMRARGDVYFNVLKKHPLRLVIAKGDRWIESQSKMPKPAEWANVYATVGGEQITWEMDDAEAREWLRAERQFWEDGVCGCNECIEAGVVDKAIRFVPMFDRDDREMRVLCFSRSVVKGEWIHGYALMRWHVARENFFTMFNRAGPKTMGASSAEQSRIDRKLIARKLLEKPERPRYVEDQ